MSETGLTNEEPHVEPPAQLYLERIGAVDKANINLLSRSFSNVLAQNQETGFIAAVGGTVKHNNPQERKDIDLLVGIKKDTGDINKYAHIEQSRIKFDLWKQIILKVTEPLIKQGVTVEEEAIYPDHEHENIAANDGKLILTFPAGRPVELLCHQGTVIDPKAIELFSNMENK